MILGINTAQKVHELCLVDLEQGKLLVEKRWTANKDEVETLIPMLQEMLEALGLEKSDINEILVVNGPGSFTSLRTGVSLANALASGLEAKLYPISTFDLLYRKAATVQKALVVLHAGGLDIGLGVYNETNKPADLAVCDDIKVGPISNLLAEHSHDNTVVIFEGTEAQHDELHSIALEKRWHLIEGHELQTMGEALLTYGLEGLSPEEGSVTPLYLKKPIITKSSDKWKN